MIEELTDLVEEAVYAEFERLSERGGVLGAMETMYQRGEDPGREPALRAAEARRLAADRRRQHVPRPRRAAGGGRGDPAHALDRGGEAAQVDGVRAFSAATPPSGRAALARLQEVARSGGNVFGELMETVKVASLGEISHALYEVGGQYRRSM